MYSDTVKQGATRFEIRRTHDLFGREYAKPRYEQVVCNDCSKLWTCYCPIRVWGRNERQETLNLDVDPERDYCSRFEFKGEAKHATIKQRGKSFKETLPSKEH